MADKLVQIKVDRWAILFVGGKDTNGQPKSCFNCPHFFEKQRTCEYMGPSVILRKITQGGKTFTPVCGYQIGGLPTSTDDPKYLGGKSPEELGLEWAEGTGTNCYGFAGGAPCEHFVHTSGEDGTCELMKDNDNKVDSDDCCASHLGPSMPWQEAQKILKSPNPLDTPISTMENRAPSTEQGSKLVALFVRHGQTEANKENLFRGAMEIPLDHEGRQQALDVRRFLAGHLGSQQLGAAFRSSKDRTRETADLVLGPGRAKMVKNFDALNVGKFSGQPKSEENMKEIIHYQQHPEEKIPGGERINDFRARVNPEIKMTIAEGEKSGHPSISFVHSSTIHQVSHLLHNDHNAVKVRPGGVVGVYRRANGTYYASALLNESRSKKDKQIMS